MQNTIVIIPKWDDVIDSKEQEVRLYDPSPFHESYASNDYMSAFEGLQLKIGITGANNFQKSGSLRPSQQNKINKTEVVPIVQNPFVKISSLRRQNPRNSLLDPERIIEVGTVGKPPIPPKMVRSKI